MISKEKIEHLAKLARLRLDEEEIKILTNDLNKILNYINKLEEINFKDIEPLTNIIKKLDFRKDETQDENKKEREKILNNFPKKEGNYLKVPKILEK